MQFNKYTHTHTAAKLSLTTSFAPKSLALTRSDRDSYLSLYSSLLLISYRRDLLLIICADTVHQCRLQDNVQGNHARVYTTIFTIDALALEHEAKPPTKTLKPMGSAERSDVFQFHFLLWRQTALVCPKKNMNALKSVGFIRVPHFFLFL